MRWRSLLVALTVLALTPVAHANLILNGDFENNTAAGSLFNRTNLQFTTRMANATGFGTAQEIDIVTRSDFGIVPQSGAWKLGINHESASFGGLVDAFSMDLSGPVLTGNMYALQFFAAGIDISRLGPVEVGLSNSATSFGTLIFSGTPASATQWTRFDDLFVAPINASFLTVRAGGGDNDYSFVDNFSLSQVPEPSTAPLLATGLAALAIRRALRASGGALSRQPDGDAVVFETDDQTSNSTLTGSSIHAARTKTY